MGSIEIDEKRMSEHVTKYASIVDLRLRSIRGELKTPTPQTPLSLSEFEVSPTMVQLSPTAVLYHVTYELAVSSANQRRACDIELTLSAMFNLTREELPDEYLRAFGIWGAIDILHPYVREIVHSLTGRMGIPPLLLDVKESISLRDASDLTG